MARRVLESLPCLASFAGGDKMVAEVCSFTSGGCVYSYAEVKRLVF